MLLRTRFYIPPLKPEHLVRTELIERLQNTSGSELVLVSAPAGYGKTTLVSQWLHTHSQSFAWLIVDAQQSVAEVFWQHVIGALQTLNPDIGVHALTILAQHGIEATVVSLLNDLDRLDIAQESNHAYTLVMDDFHKAESNEILTSFNLFLDHLPPSLRIVMTVRQDPKLALARRRANGQLVEFQQQDLAFSAEECQAFLQDKWHSDISHAAAQQLTLATEGWITGIQLSAMTDQATGLPLDLVTESAADKHLNRDMADYLFEEVFSLQAEHLQEFLICTACVDKFCPALTNHLIGIDNSFHLIKQLETANLFIIALDNHQAWYRYHDLFLQFLRLHFQTLGPKKQQDLHVKAAAWFEQAGDYEAAFQHALQLEDWQQCALLINTIATDKIDQGLILSLPPLIDQLPTSIAEPIRKKLGLKIHNEKDPINHPKLTDLAEPLTKREAQVMALVQQGLSNKDIAEKLFISLNTLKVHIRNLYGKMGVENRTQALLKLSL